MDTPNKQMNDYWHIPRASLASSASSSSAASYASTQSHSNAASLAKRSSAQRMHQHHHHQQQQQNNINGMQQRPPQQQRPSSPPRYMVNNLNAVAAAPYGQRDHDHHLPQPQQQSRVLKAKANANVGSNGGNTKRGSRSSQGSSDSNNSTRSAASGSLLLTAANLERFAEIHRKQQKYNNNSANKLMPVAVHAATAAAVNQYNANLMAATGGASSGVSPPTQTLANGDIVMDMSQHVDFMGGKTKDGDNISIASSMHFTMVNGEGGPSSKKPKRGLCDRGRQVTVLIVSMSLIFLLLIMGMVYALEMRAREMPQS